MSIDTAASAQQPPSVKPRLGGLLILLIILELVSGTTQGWVTPLLPAIGTDMGVTVGALNWVSSAYLLAGVILVPLMSKLGDLFGHRRLLRVALALAVVGALVVAFASSYPMLLTGRVLLGSLSVFLPLLIALVRNLAPGQAAAGIGMLFGALTIGNSLGTLASGALYKAVPHLTLVLVIPAVLLAGCTVLAWVKIPESTVRATGSIDWRGVLTLSGGLSLVLLAIGNGNAWGWTSLSTLGCLLVGTALLAAWVLTALRIAEPLIDLRAMGSSGVGPLYVISLLLGAQLFGSMTMIALLAGTPPDEAGYGLGLNSLQIGMLMVVYGAVSFGAATYAAKISQALGERGTLISGSLLSAAGFAAMALGHSTVAPFTLGIAATGLGTGLVMAAVPSMIVHRVAPEVTGIATGIYNTARVAAGAAIGAVFATVFTSLTADGASHPELAAYVTALSILAALCLAMVATALALRAPAQPDPPAAGVTTT